MNRRDYYSEKRDVEQAVGESLMEVSPAQKGAAWLDEHHPGWAARVNLAYFDIEDSSRCVLGQVFEQEADPHDDDGYGYALDKYDIEDEDLGFSSSEYYVDKPELAEKATWPAGSIIMPHQHNQDWSALQAEWQAIITARQNA